MLQEPARHSDPPFMNTLPLQTSSLREHPIVDTRRQNFAIHHESHHESRIKCPRLPDRQAVLGNAVRSTRSLTCADYNF